MHRQLIRSTCFVFLGLVYILNLTESHASGEYVDDVVPDSGNYLRLQKESSEEYGDSVTESESSYLRLQAGADKPFRKTIPKYYGSNYLSFQADEDQPFKERVPVTDTSYLSFQADEDQPFKERVPVTDTSYLSFQADEDQPFKERVPVYDTSYLSSQTGAGQPFGEWIPVTDISNYLRFDNEADEPSREEIPIIKRRPSFVPYISIGALSNMQQFFQNLKENFRALENLSPEERNALLGKHEQSADKDYKIVELSLPREKPTGNFDFTLPLLDDYVLLRLRPVTIPPHPNFAYLIRTYNNTKIVNDEVDGLHECFFTSRQNDVKATVDLCEGLNGVIQIKNELYLIKPLPRAYQKSKAITFHVVFKATSFKLDKGSLGNSRKKRSFGSVKEAKIETAVFVDRDLYRHMLNNFPNNTERNLLRFVLAMINAVQLLYHDSSLEIKVSFVLKRLEILHADPPELRRSHDIDRYLSSFCTWQEKENVPREKSPLHWDHALMLTGLDLYVITKSGKFSNQVLGLAPVAGMCEPRSSCTVNEGLHFESVYVVAHEIGHNLGMRHDGPSADNDCDSNSHIMSPTLGSGKSTWSPCSNRYLRKFLQSPQAQCLFETTYVELDHTEGGTFPGERFDSNLQCMLKYGKQSERSPTQNMEEICRDLRCTKERYTWTSHPALEGTKCGQNKWCRFGRCVLRGHVNLSGRIVDGGWSDWSSFSDCASGCLYGNHHLEVGSTGIAIASRTCNKPRPENGGKQCTGNDKKFQTCEALQCSNVPPITITEFAEQICRRAREVDKDLTGLGFQRNTSDPEEACTVWCYRYNGGAKTRGWIFPDGTACASHGFTHNPRFCVSGRCEEFDCHPNNTTTFLADRQHCQSKYVQLKPLEPGWITTGPCRYNCITPGVGFKVLKRGLDRNIQTCEGSCSKKKTLFEYATNLCTRYKERVMKLSGLGIQLSATLEDPDRPCHVACQDEKFSYRFYLVTGEDGWFPFGADCARGILGKKAYCVSGKCLEFGKNDMPIAESEITFANMRRKRSLEVENKTVIAMVDLKAVLRVIDMINNGNASFSQPNMFSIDFDNPIHVKPDWELENKTFAFSNLSSN